MPTMFTRISHEYAAEKICLDFLERLLCEHGYAVLADRLSECEIYLQCTLPPGSFTLTLSGRFYSVKR